jgi:hypothetical protein
MEQTQPMSIDEVQRMQMQRMLEPYVVAANAARRASGMETIAGDPQADAMNDALGYKPRNDADPARAEAAKANANVIPPDEMARRAYARKVSANAFPSPEQLNAEWDRREAGSR